MSDAFKPLLARLADGATLVGEDADAFFSACLRGEPTPAQIAAAVTAMRLRGETVGEITACARALRRAALTLDHDFPVIDVCGTGGDGAHTLNISTAVAFVAAGGGLKVAKHGNRAASSRSGSSDVLAALGVNLHRRTRSAQRRALAEADDMCVTLRPGPPRGHAPRPSDPSGTGFSHDLQPAWPPFQPGRRTATGAWCFRQPLGRARGAGAGRAGRRARLGRARRWPG